MPEQLAQRWRYTADNRGVGGSCSTATAALLRADPPPPAKVYLLMTGLNDLRLGGNPGAFKAYGESLETIFESLHQANPSAVVIDIARNYPEDRVRELVEFISY